VLPRTVTRFASQASVLIALPEHSVLVSAPGRRRSVALSLMTTVAASMRGLVRTSPRACAWWARTVNSTSAPTRFGADTEDGALGERDGYAQGVGLGGEAGRPYQQKDRARVGQYERARCQQRRNPEQRPPQASALRR
jgi:hypothetical protein